jgi:tRNA dimethylallyltransferase
MNKTLIVIVGATAVGKTALSIELALHFNTEIISTDSRQFYKELNIGTAKPSELELNKVNHHFINSHNITENYNVGDFEKDALNCLEKLFTKYNLVIAVGGSGLYVKALCEGLDEFPEFSPQIRVDLQTQLETEGLEKLVERLKILDEKYCQEADLNNPQRVMRALEVCLGTGKPYSSFRTHIKKERPFQIIKIGLDIEREILYQRIDERMDNMLLQGLRQEAERLQQFAAHNALQTVGYQEIFDFLEDKYDWNECVRLLKRNSRRYAKRQLTWFRADKEITWFLPTQKKEIIAHIENRINI